MSNIILHKANTRGYANHGWLQTYHSFSFADYHNAERMRFGVLRVLNDDIVAGGMGFGMHPHDNMEIITIVLSGVLEHKDNMGHTQVIQENDVQVMSAGTGILHSEYNKNKDISVELLQIWVFPSKRNVEPRYDQKTFEPTDRKNKLQQIISPDLNKDNLWIYQNAWFYLSNLDKDFSIEYTLKNTDNSIYAFIIDGDVTIHNQMLNKRDGLGILNEDKIFIEANSSSKLLLMELAKQ